MGEIQGEANSTGKKVECVCVCSNILLWRSYASVLCWQWEKFVKQYHKNIPFYFTA